MKIAVIGAGIGGLAVAIRLRAQGHAVTMYEKNDRAGGKIATRMLEGCRFDTGPSLFTLPELVEELFGLCGERMQDTIPYRRLETDCRYFYPDGSDLTFYHDPMRLKRELQEKGITDPDAVDRRLRHAREVYELSAPVFLFSDFHKLSRFNTPPYRRVARNLWKLDFFCTMHQANRHDFADARLVRIFDRYATYNGSDPYRAPATFNMIAHLENNIGAFFPEGGMQALAAGLYALAQRQGVAFRFGVPVTRILVENGRAVGVRTSQGDIYCDRIVSDADVRYLAEHLLDAHPLQKRLRRSEPSSSALIFYWAVAGLTPQLDVHNILFSEDYRAEFRALFQARTIPADPTVYVFVSSKAVAADAPAGWENWFVMVNAPVDCGQAWSSLIAETRSHVMEKIDRLLHTRIASRIRAEAVASPPSIEQATWSPGGALYGTSSNSVWSAFLRHPNMLPRIPGLYFVGGSVHPGGGIPLCLASAAIVSGQIAEQNG